MKLWLYKLKVVLENNLQLFKIFSGKSFWFYWDKSWLDLCLGMRGNQVIAMFKRRALRESNVMVLLCKCMLIILLFKHWAELESLPPLNYHMLFLMQAVAAWARAEGKRILGFIVGLIRTKRKSQLPPGVALTHDANINSLHCKNTCPPYVTIILKQVHVFVIFTYLTLIGWAHSTWIHLNTDWNPFG